MFSAASVGQLVSLVFVSRITEKKTTQRICTTLGGKVARGTRKKPLDFDGNPCHELR